MDIKEVEGFVAAWVAAWNAHDVDAVLALFHDDAMFASPFASRVFPERQTIFRGKSEIRRYWRRALELIPDLHFEIERYFVGIGAVVIQYRNHRNVTVCEMLMLDGDLVRSGFGTYLPETILNGELMDAHQA